MEDNSITIGNYALGHHWPYSTTQKLMQSCSANTGPTTVLELLKLKCWTVFGKFTMTCCQQLQHVPNVGPTIGCYLGLRFYDPLVIANGK